MKSTAEISPSSVLRSDILSLALFTSGLAPSHHALLAFAGRKIEIKRMKMMGLRNEEDENGDPEISVDFFILSSEALNAGEKVFGL